MIHIQRTWKGIDRWEFFFYVDDLRGGREYGKLEDGKLVWHKVEESELVEPTFTLTGMEMRYLKQAVSEYGPTDTESLELARDAIKVRDRLLTIVERVIGRAGQQ